MGFRWPEVRAGLIAIAIGFGLVDGCPLPEPENTPAWERGFVEPVRAVRDLVETPVAWIGRDLRVSQQWALYQHPAGTHYRMWIEGQGADGSWQLLYRAGDPDHAEDAAVLDSGRVWGAYSPTDRPPEQYPRFTRWITDRFAARHPELLTVRVRMEELAIHAGVATPTGKFVFAYVHPRMRP